jgi:hypothetical protein
MTAVRRPIFPRRHRREKIGFAIGRRKAHHRRKISVRRGLKRKIIEHFKTFLQNRYCDLFGFRFDEIRDNFHARLKLAMSNKRLGRMQL